MNLVMPASTGSSYTMSAHDRPVWGRAAGTFSTFTASAGRSGTRPPAAFLPDSGQMVGGGDGEGDEFDDRVPSSASGPIPLRPPRYSTPPTTPPITSSVMRTAIRARPRLVGLMLGRLL